MSTGDIIIKGIRHEIGRRGYDAPPEGAYVDQDYPFGFRLRCKRAHWLETATMGKGRGETRHVTCTTNPKRAGDPWNKPKPGGYSLITILYIKGDHHGGSAGQVGSAGLSFGASLGEVDAFEARWSGQLDEFELNQIAALRKWLARMEGATLTINGVPQAPKPVPTDADLREVIPTPDQIRERLEAIDPKHNADFCKAMDRADRMAQASGLRALVIYHPCHSYQPFRVYPATPACIKEVWEHRAVYTVVDFVDPPGPDPDPSPDPYDSEIADPQGSGLDWPAILRELDRAPIWERQGRSVQVIQLCDELQYPEDHVYLQGAKEAESLGFNIISEPDGLYLKRDCGPIPEEEPADDYAARADDDGMAHADVPIPRPRSAVPGDVLDVLNSF